jgi:hypothetical protein
VSTAVHDPSARRAHRGAIDCSIVIVPLALANVCAYSDRAPSTSTRLAQRCATAAAPSTSGAESTHGAGAATAGAAHPTTGATAPASVTAKARSKRALRSHEILPALHGIEWHLYWSSNNFSSEY